eukprot:SAG22_NODE_302_length_12743_cov_12.397738_9_plen_110_part_00
MHLLAVCLPLLKCVNPPGSVYSDPAMGYAILGHIVENVSGLSLWQYCAFKIFDGLSMSTTTFGGPGFPNPGPDPNALKKEELEAKAKSDEKLAARQVRRLVVGWFGLVD